MAFGKLEILVVHDGEPVAGMLGSKLLSVVRRRFSKLLATPVTGVQARGVQAGNVGKNYWQRRNADLKKETDDDIFSEW
jgi:hypothetical protein